MPEDAPTRPSQDMSPDCDLTAVRRQLRKVRESGDTPLFEDYLVGVNPDQQTALLFKLIAEDASIRIELGEQPAWNDYAETFSRLRLRLENGMQSNQISPPSSDTQSDPDCFGLLDPTMSFVTIDQQDTLRFPEPSHGLLQVGVRLGDRYLIEEKIGQGGMGQVYRAQDLRLQRDVAIKVVRLDITLETIEDRRMNEAFEREAQLGAGLFHPAIATVHDYGFHEGKAFTVFEYVSGQSLRDCITDSAPMGIEDVRAVVGELSQAIDFAHKHGVIHRDLKPENIRFTSHRVPKILDLGLALRFRETSHWKFAGTPAYASPEQCRELPIDGRADQYALALIAYEMLAGRRPFQASDWKSLLQMHQNVEPTRLRQLVPGIPDGVDSAIHRALRKDPNRRFANCKSFAMAIGCLLRSDDERNPSTHSIFDVKLSGYHPRLIRVLQRRASIMYHNHELWLLDGTSLQCWPIAAVRKMRRKNGALELVLQGGKHLRRFWLSFSSASDQKGFVDRIGDVPSDGLFELKQDWSPSRPLLPIVAEGLRAPYQILSNVEATGDTNKLAKQRLLMEAVSHGSEALINVRSEQFTMPYRQRSRMEGLGIRVLGSQGRIEITLFQYSERAKRLANRMMLVLAGFMLVFVVLAGNCFLMASDDAAIKSLALLSPLVWILWPLIVSCWLRWSRLPNDAFAVALAFCGLIPFWIASIVDLTVVVIGFWRGQLNPDLAPSYIVFVSFVGLPSIALVGSIVLGYSVKAAYEGWRFFWDSRVLDTKLFAGSPFRRVVSFLLIAASIVYSTFAIIVSIFALARILK